MLINSGYMLSDFAKNEMEENCKHCIVRVFLSSTFKDMKLEREVIMRKVMVELASFCYKRSVHLTYIDMRWGNSIIENCFLV